MRRLLKILGGLLLVFVVFVVIVAAMGLNRTETGSLTLESATYARREGDYAAFLASFANTTDAPIDNPQLRVVVDLNGRTYSCPGYFDTVADQVVAGMDPVTRPLVIPAQAESSVTILCQMPDVAMNGTRVRMR